MKRALLKFTFITLFLLCGNADLLAATKKVTIDNIIYSVNTTEKRAQVKGRSEEATKNWKLTIPDEILTEWGSIKVTSVASQAFMYDDYLTSVTLSNYTETVGSEAFFACSNLKTVKLGYSIKILGYRAFSNAGVTSITLPASLEIIRDEVFAAAQKLREVTFDRNTSKLESIGFAAFWKTSIESIIIPGCVKTIGKEAFGDCNSLVSVSFLSGNGKTVIGEDCFNNLKNLKRVTFGSPGVETIQNGGFIACAINEVVFPSTLKTIGNWAFSSNELIKVVFNEGLTDIGHGAFEGQRNGIPGMTILDSLKALELPSTLKSIGEQAFFNLSDDLVTVTCKAVTPPTALELAFNVATQLHGVLWVPVGSVTAYQTANIWKDFYDIRGIGTSSISTIDSPESNSITEYYSLDGIKVNPLSLTPGVYIRKTNSKTEKILIRE